MTSRAEQLVAAPSWGKPPRLRALPAEGEPPRLVPAAATLADVAGAALVLGGALALWAAFLVAVW